MLQRFMWNSQRVIKVTNDKHQFNLSITVVITFQCKHINNINWVKNS